jgi:hypothetical protein
MPTPGEHKTVQARILAYAEAIGWTIVSRVKGATEPTEGWIHTPKNRTNG